MLYDEEKRIELSEKKDEYLKECGVLMDHYTRSKKKTKSGFDWQRYIEDSLNALIEEEVILEDQKNDLAKIVSNKVELFEFYWIGDSNRTMGRFLIIEFMNGFFMGLKEGAAAKIES